MRKAACRAALINRAAGLVSLTPSTIWKSSYAYELGGLCLRWKAETEASGSPRHRGQPHVVLRPGASGPPETATRLNRPCTRRRPRGVPEY